MDETAAVAATSDTAHRSMVGYLHARQDLNLRLPVLETGVLAARPRTHRGQIPVKRKAEALIAIAEATNGVRSRARSGAFTFQVRPLTRPGAPSRIRTCDPPIKSRWLWTRLSYRGEVPTPRVELGTLCFGSRRSIH